MQRPRTLLGRQRGDGKAPLIVGHRGCADQYPENTIAAIEAAAPHVDAVEIDVRRCGSGELVVFHDDTLDRVTDREGRVAETPLSTLEELRVCGSDATIPTLEELLAGVPDGVAVNVELKEPGVAEAAMDVCAAAETEVLYSSFFPQELRTLRAADGDAPLAVLCHQGVDQRLALAEELNAVAFHPSVELAVETDVVTSAHERGLAVNVWTAETASDVETLRERGVDGIIADRWDVF